MKTVISEIGNMIQSTCEALVSFKGNPLMNETEDFIYESLIEEEKQKAILELEKAKKLLNDNNRTSN